MRWFETFISWLFPNLLVTGTPWGSLWQEKERASFIQSIRLFLLVASGLYVAHYYFYDVPNNLEPLTHWKSFRFSMAAFLLSCLGFYISPLVRMPIYRFPGMVACLTICSSQAYVALWHGRESWVFCYILTIACVLGLRLSAFKSLAFAVVASSFQAPILIKAGIPVSYIISGSLVSAGISLFIRASYLLEVKSFVLDQQNLAAQKKIIELNIDFSDRLRSFLPKVIAKRIDESIEIEGRNILEASIEVLSSKRKRVACLFSDIRGYTKNSRRLDEFLVKSVLPEVKACTEAIEEREGIPRKIGDLLFAYFDGDQDESNILRCVASALAIARINEAMNATAVSVQIRRYVLIAHGEAVVGNLGGFDSSVEITALGSPVNFLSRMDEATKSPGLGSLLKSGDLILAPETFAELKTSICDIDYTEIDLGGLGVKIRDFPEVERIFILPASDANVERLFRAVNGQTAVSRSLGNIRAVAA